MTAVDETFVNVGSLTLFSGDPGIGKSTMLLQIADMIASVQKVEAAGAEAGSPMKESDAVLYVTAEESVDQARMPLRDCILSISDTLYLPIILQRMLCKTSNTVSKNTHQIELVFLRKKPYTHGKGSVCSHSPGLRRR